MAIRIYRTPQQREDVVEVSVVGETLTINGEAFDLTGVIDPQELDSDLVRGPVFRLNGDVHVLIVQPYQSGEVPPEADEMPSYPAPEPETVVYPVDLWSRMTNAEADAVEAAMTTQPARIQNIFRSASSYRSDHELWPLLVSMATNLFGSERAAEILAAS